MIVLPRTTRRVCASRREEIALKVNAGIAASSAGAAGIAVAASAVAVMLCYLGLIVVGLRSWARTGLLRRGRPPPEALATAVTRTSRTTYLAALAGVSVVAWGVSAVAEGSSRGPPTVVAVVVAMVGAGSAAAAVQARVAALEWSSRGLVVRYGRRAPFVLAWADCSALSPPRTPVGGWRVAGRHGRRTLMPSDLLGHEQLLAVVIRESGLRFDGRMWRRIR